MIRRFANGIAPGLLASALVSLALAALLAVSLSAPPRRWEAPPAPVSASPAPSGASLPAPVRIDTADTLARPLFVPSRRPAAPAVSPGAGPGGAAAPAAVSSLTLLGTVVGPGARIALIRAPNAAAALRLSPGQSAGGWEVVEITQDRVTLRSGGMVQELLAPPPSQIGGASHPAARPPSPASPH